MPLQIYACEGYAIVKPIVKKEETTIIDPSVKSMKVKMGEIYSCLDKEGDKEVGDYDEVLVCYYNGQAAEEIEFDGETFDVVPKTALMATVGRRP